MKYLYLSVAIAAIFGQTASAKPHQRICATNLPTWKHPSKLPNGTHHLHTYHHKNGAGLSSATREDDLVMVALLAAKGDHHTQMTVKGGKMTRLSLTPHGTKNAKVAKGKKVRNKKRGGMTSFDRDTDVTLAAAATEMLIRFTFEMGPFKISFYFPISAVANSACDPGPPQDDSNVPDSNGGGGPDMASAEPAPQHKAGLLSGACLELTPWQRRSRI